MFKKPDKQLLIWKSQLRYYGSVVSGIVKKRTRVREAYPPVVGCADDAGDVYIARFHPLFDRVAKEITNNTEAGRQILRLFGKKSKDIVGDVVNMFRLGIVVHEALHQLLTNFDYFNKFLSSKIKSGEIKYDYEMQVFAFINNVVEDPAIENFSSQFIGGVAIKALRFAIALTQIVQKALGTGARNAYDELCNALIQFGDMGVIKGEFEYPEAKTAFARIAPVFYDAINEPDNKKRVDKSWDIYLELKPLWQDKNTEEMEEFLKQVKETFDNLLESDPNILNRHSKGQNAKQQSQNSKINQKRSATIKKVSREEYEKAKEKMKNQNPEDIPVDAEAVIPLPEDFNEEDARELLENSIENSSNDASSGMSIPVSAGNQQLNNPNDNGQQPQSQSSQKTDAGSAAGDQGIRQIGKSRNTNKQTQQNNDNEGTNGQDSKQESANDTANGQGVDKTVMSENSGRKSSDNDEEEKRGIGKNSSQKMEAGSDSSESEAEDNVGNGGDSNSDERSGEVSGKGSYNQNGINSDEDLEGSEVSRLKKASEDGENGDVQTSTGGKNGSEEGEDMEEPSLGLNSDSNEGDGQDISEEDVESECGQTGTEPFEGYDSSSSLFSSSGNLRESNGSSKSSESTEGTGISPHGIARETAPAELTAEEVALLEEEDEHLDFVENDFSSILNGIHKERDRIESELEDAAEYYSEIQDYSSAISSADGFEGYSANNRYVETTDDALSEQYDNLIEDIGEYIDPFKDEIDGIFEADRAKKEYAETGAKVNLKRLALHKGARVFERKTLPGHKNDACFVIAVDNSGSTSGDKNLQEKIACIGIAEALAELDIPLYVFGFNVLHNDTPVQTHYVRWENSRFERERLLCMQANGCNFDSYSIRYATQLLEERSERNKMLIIVSDGCPSSGFSWEEGIRQNALAVDEARSHGIKVLGMSVGDDVEEKDFVRMYGLDGYVAVINPGELFDNLSERIKTAIEEG